MFARESQFARYLQTQEAECGLMCLAAAAESLGRNISAVEARQWFSGSARGTSIASLCETSKALGLIPTAVACAADEINGLAFPAILHWGNKHFCLALSRRGSRYIVFNPAKGIEKLTLTEVAENFSGAAVQLALDLSAPLHKKHGGMARFLWTFARQARVQIAVLLGLSFVLQLAALAAPLLSQVAINLGAIEGNLAAISMVAGSLVAVYVTNFTVEAWRSRINHSIASHLSESASRQLFRHMLYLPTEWFERRRVADAVSRFESVEPIRAAVSSGLATLIVDGSLGLVVAVGLLLISPTLGAAVVATVAAAALAKAAFGSKLASETALAAASRTHEHAKRWETFRAIATVKLAAAESAQERVWAEKMDKYLLHVERSQRITTLQQSVASLISSAGGVLVLYYGALMVAHGRLSIGALFAFVMYRRYLSDKIGAAVDQINNLWSLRYHVDRITEVFQAPKEKRWNDLRETGDYVMAGTIELRQVSFRHSSSEPPLLRNIDVKFNGGEMVFISGPSGAGKTTLLRLVAGIAAPTAGTIALDAVSLSNFSPYQLRGAVAAVLQDDELFAGTIFENVTMFDSDPQLDSVIAALQSAELWADVKEMPLGLHTPVGESGRLISAGQRQRILIARAFYRDPKIFILDEATANLDPQIEERVMARLKAHPATKLVVSHNSRLSHMADRTFVLDRRGLREFGRRVDLAEAQ